MPTIQEQLNQLKKDKETLNTMLNTMGVETKGDETFTQLAPLVGKIVADPILQNKSVEITENGTTNVTADEGYDGLNSVEVITNVGGSGDKIAPMSIDFKYYKGTEIKGLNNLDTTNMTLMNNMFRECSNIQGLDLSNFDTSNVTNMSYMFYICSKLIELDLSSFNTSKVTTMRDMFNNCASLKKLDIRNFTFDTVTDTGNMFANIPTDCLIIVKDNTTKDKVLAIRSRLTNVKTVAELG